MLASGAFHEFQRASAKPTTTGLNAPPRLPKVFIAPLTTPACMPPISRQTAQAGATPSAASPAAALRYHAERIGSAVDIPATIASAASGNPTTPGARRPAREPRRRT